MKPCLADVNVWLALLVKNHNHHRLVTDWSKTMGPATIGLCRPVQLSLLRLLANRTVMGSFAMPAGTGWELIRAAGRDDRADFLSEPTGIDDILPHMFGYPVPTPKLVNDAYLAAFAIASNRTLVTLDAGFRQYRGLDVALLTD